MKQASVLVDRPMGREAASGWHPFSLVEPCRDEQVKPCLDDQECGYDDRECGYDDRSGSYRLNKCQEDNDDGPPPHLACVIITADAQVLYCDPKSTHRLDRRTLPLQITVRDLGQLLVC
jgi:hypothetical protein